MVWRRYVLEQCSLGFAFALGLGVGLLGCDPSDFDQFKPSDAGAESDNDASKPDAGRGGHGGAAAHGGSGGKATGAAGGAGAGGAGAAGQAAAADGGGSGGSGGGAAGEGGSGGGSGAGGAGPAPCVHPTDLSKVKIGTSETGELAIPSWVDQRTLASATVVKDRVLLLFTVPDRTGMAAWGDVQGLTSSPPRVSEMAPYTPLFDSSAYPADRSFSLGSGVADGNTALVYFASTQGFTLDAAGIGRLALGGASAEVLRAASALFPPADNAPAWRPVFVNGALVVTEGDVDYVYVYACQGDPNKPDEADDGPRSKPCRLARVPRPDAATAESYRYWNGSEWSADVTSAAIVVDHAGGNVSVSYNAYLQKYLMVHSSLANSAVLRWADRPEGPWNALGELSTVMASGGFGTTFNAIELTGLRDACQQVTYLAYNSSVSAPTPTDANAADYATRFVRVELK